MSQSKSRRQFLQDATKSLGLVGISPWMSQFLIQTIASEAFAQSSSLSDKIHIFFALPGGPPRWMFDLPLTPKGSATAYSGAFSHTGMGTYVARDGAANSKAIYKPWYDVETKYWLPPVWGSKPGGGSFRNCLSNTLFVRGIDQEFNAHEIGRLRNQSPIIGGTSIGGLLAERTGSSFPGAVSGTIAKAFKGSKFVAPVTLDYRVTSNVNPISTATKYFNSRQPTQNEGVTQALAEFDKYAANKDFSHRGLVQAKEKADALIEAGVTIFQDKWNQTYSKYVRLVDEALFGTNTGLFVDNAVIPVPKGSDVRTKTSSNTMLDPKMSDLRNMIKENQTTVANLASTYAAIEILITMGLTQVVTTDLGTLSALAASDTGTKFNLNNDQHDVGSLVSTLATTYYYRAILNCTEELIGVLKTQRLYDKTVIQFGAEFNRNPNIDGSGSDHGFKGGSALIMSGMITKTSVIGNTKADTEARYAGTWGLAANHPVRNSKTPIRMNEVVITVCKMLGIDPFQNRVTNNGSVLLQEDGGLWKPYTNANGEARNV